MSKSPTTCAIRRLIPVGCPPPPHPGQTIHRCTTLHFLWSNRNVFCIHNIKAAASSAERRVVGNKKTMTATATETSHNNTVKPLLSGHARGNGLKPLNGGSSEISMIFSRNVSFSKTNIFRGLWQLLEKRHPQYRTKIQYS